MEKYFSYFRVSSTNQAENGVSLEAQQEANQKFAKEKNYEIVKEFREVQSAAKQGRKQFSIMLAEIKKRKNINGIIFHDVDRSSRSICDWAKIKELSNLGMNICFSRDGSDLSTRGSNLTASIKAVIAEDFIANLSQETKKGLYKKAEQGFTVFGHPVIGYINKGGGIREIDSVTSPLIRKCFELYSTGKYTQKELADEMYKRGLRTKNGKKLEHTKISRILNNKYYIGLFVVKGKIYNGKHKPIIPIKLFEKVQSVLQRRFTPHTKRNKYKFPHIFICGYCGKPMRTMMAKHKYYYYSCREKSCNMKAVLENKIEGWLLNEISKIKFTNQEVKQMMRIVGELRNSYVVELQNKEKGMLLQIENCNSRLSKLTDMLLDNTITKEVYEQKREQFIMEKKVIESEINDFKGVNTNSFNRIDELIKLLSDPLYAYELANHENKANLITKMMKNIKILPLGVSFEWQTPFLALYQRKNEHLSSSFQQGVARENRTLVIGTTTRCTNRCTIATMKLITNF